MLDPFDEATAKTLEELYEDSNKWEKESVDLRGAAALIIVRSLIRILILYLRRGAR